MKIALAQTCYQAERCKQVLMTMDDVLPLSVAPDAFAVILFLWHKKQFPGWKNYLSLLSSSMSIVDFDCRLKSLELYFPDISINEVKGE